MSESTDKAAEWWSDPGHDVPGTQWPLVPGATENMNRRATGDPEMDWITHSAGLLAKFPRPIKALSLGCGFGIIERVLRRSDYCQIIHGMDVAEGAIEGAKKAARDEGLDGLTYEVADLNSATLPEETYDAVYIHAALHHVFQLEHLLDQIKRTLKPGGLFVLYEYIGPAQMQFPRRDLELADAFLRAIPERYRNIPGVNDIKKDSLRLPLDRMNVSDPSESIRATEIVPLTASRFEVRHFKYVGGTLLLLIFSQIAGNFREDDDEIMPLVRALIELDNFLIDNKVLPSYHVYMVCEKTENPMPMQAHNILPQSVPTFPTDNLESLTVESRPNGLITAEPNPFRPDSKGMGQVTLTWLASRASKVEVRINAPNGPLLAKHGPGRHSQVTRQWVRDGMTFYLQNVSKGLPLTAQNTIATVTVKSM